MLQVGRLPGGQPETLAMKGPRLGELSALRGGRSSPFWKVLRLDPEGRRQTREVSHDIEKLILLDRVLLWTKEAKRCFLERGTGVEPV